MKFIAILLFFCISIAPLDMASQCSRAKDSLVLREFFIATQGDFWINKTNWVQPGLPISSYKGIKLNSAGCVQEIKLTGNNLQGFLPPSIGTLSGITVFDITNNSVGGNVPTQITNLTNLKKLSLAQNKFNGNIPSTIGNLVNIEDLILSQNNFTGSIPSSISMCTKLVTLSLSQNSIFGSIPLSIGQLPRLSFIYLDDNKFAGQIPSTFYDLPNLQELWAFNNGFVGTLDPAVGNWTKLQKLLLQNNKLTGTIPSSIGQLTSLVSFHISDNQISGSIPNEIVNCKSLVSLQMARNEINGTLPRDMDKMTALSTLDITDNNITGTIPERLGYIPNLKRVFMANNDLEGCFPQSLRKLCSFMETSNVNTNGYNFRGNVELIHGGDFAKWCTGDGWVDAKVEPLTPICEGSKVVFKASGGEKYLWSGPAGFTSQEQNPIIDPFLFQYFGKYFVIVTNQFQCIDTAFVEVKPVGNTEVTVNPLLCEGETIKLSASGGNSYSWTGPNGFVSNLPNPEITNTSYLNEGQYVVIIDIGNCKVTKSVDVKFDAISSTISTSTPSLCVGDTIKLNASLENGQTISWSGPNNFASSNPNVTILNSTSSNSGKYQAIIRTGNGCQSTKFLDVFVNPRGKLTMPVLEPICGTDEPIILPSIIDTVKGIWTGPNIMLKDQEFSFLPNNLQGDVVLTFIPPQGSCIEEGTTKIKVSNIEVVATENTPSNNEEDNNGSILLKLSGDQQGVIVSITGVKINLDVSVNNKEFIIDNLPSGEYTLVAKSEAGCLDTTQAIVRYSKKFYFMPNVINSQSVLEKSFYLKGSNVLSYDMQIFDRWGNMVFNGNSLQINDSSMGWLPIENKYSQGLYIYLLTVHGIDGVERVVGSVTIL